jgi:hypothetical protein
VKPADFPSLSNDALVDLLFLAEDRLSKEVALEIVSRGWRIVPRLAAIASDQKVWEATAPRWWAAVHATFILAAIGGGAAGAAIVKALRMAIQLDCDVVLDEMWTILGWLDPATLPALQEIACDRSADWFLRSLVMNGMAGIALRHPGNAESVSEVAGRILSNTDDTLDARAGAANTLMDLGIESKRDEIVALGELLEAEIARDPDFTAPFEPGDIEEAFDGGSPVCAPSDALDWMSFYDPERIEERQQEYTEWESDTGRGELDVDDDLHACSICGRSDDHVHEKTSDEEPRTYIRPTSKVGRNDPCPCGSGKKFKKCCLGKSG